MPLSSHFSHNMATFYSFREDLKYHFSTVIFEKLSRLRMVVLVWLRASMNEYNRAVLNKRHTEKEGRRKEGKKDGSVDDGRILCSGRK